jgi:hypothetical protein
MKIRSAEILPVVFLAVIALLALTIVTSLSGGVLPLLLPMLGYNVNPQIPIRL